MAHQTVSMNWDEGLVPTADGRTAAPSPDCPVEVSLAAISGRWTTLVLRNLMAESMSYTQLAESLPTLSDKVLVERLSALMAKGLVQRRVTRDFPSRTAYRLTGAGEALRPLLIELYRTGLAVQEHRKSA